MSDDETPQSSVDNGNAVGSYLVGRNKPPEHGKFRKGDGRKRGRRAKGTRNFATDFNEEMAEVVTLTVNGKSKKVSRQRSIIMRVADNASRGVPSAVKTVFDIRQKLGDQTSNTDNVEHAKQSEQKLENLDDYELKVLEWLLSKLQGVEFEEIEPTIPEGPLSYRFLPPSIDRSYLESTHEGVLYRRYRCVGDPFDIITVGSKAYHSAALPRRYGRSRYNSEMRQ